MFLDMSGNAHDSSVPAATTLATPTATPDKAESASTLKPNFDSSFDFDSAFDVNPQLQPPATETSTSTVSVENSFDFDAGSFDAVTTTTTTMPTISPASTPNVKQKSPSVTPKKKPAAGGKLSLTPPASSAAASSSAAIAKRKKAQAQANPGALKPPLLPPVKKPSNAPISRSSSSISEDSAKPSSSASGFNFDDAFSSPALPSTIDPQITDEQLSASPCSVDVILNTFEELLSITKKGVVEKFEVSGVVKLSASSLKDKNGGARNLGQDEHMIVQIAVTDTHRHIATVVGAAPSQYCTVTTEGTQVASATLRDVPLVSQPLLSYRVVPSFRPELLRAKSVVTLNPSDKTVSIAIQVMLNTKFPALLENIQVMASLASFVEAAGTETLQDVKSRPASGVYNPSKSVLSWECGSHLPVKVPVLKMEILMAAPSAVLINPAVMPTSIPIIVKALMNTPVLVDCKVEVISVAVVPASPLTSIAVSPVNKWKSKCEYRFL
jgi:hypothetical protein